jgi:DNA (cytosine-5)-methyltransferase 1
MRALDLFSGAGGASMGLYMAGFEVTGVDIENQVHYPPFLKFIRADATTFPLDGFDFIWASPICQKHTQLNYLHRSRKYEDFIPIMRKRLIASGIPWVIENVPNSPLARGALVLCGTMFGLQTTDGRGELRRHRIFETSFGKPLTPRCQHTRRAVRIFGTHGGYHTLDQTERRTVREHGHAGGIARGIQMFNVKEWREAMGIGWMTGAELSQAIPPAYSEFIARYFLASQHALSLGHASGDLRPGFDHG